METSATPTPRQQELYEFIRDQIYERGYGPTVRELCERFDIRSPNGAVAHLKALQKKGFIERKANMSRAIRLLKDPSHPSQLPVVAAVSGERLSMVEAGKEFCEVGGAFPANRGAKLAAVTVRGDALADEHVVAGDLIVVDTENSPRKGQTVILTIDGKATVRKWVPEKGGVVRLEPIAGSKKAISVKSPEVVGVVVGIIRRLGK